MLLSVVMPCLDEVKMLQTPIKLLREMKEGDVSTPTPNS